MNQFNELNLNTGLTIHPLTEDLFPNAYSGGVLSGVYIISGKVVPYRHGCGNASLFSTDNEWRSIVVVVQSIPSSRNTIPDTILTSYKPSHFS